MKKLHNKKKLYKGRLHSQIPNKKTIKMGLQYIKREKHEKRLNGKKIHRNEQYSKGLFTTD